MPTRRQMILILFDDVHNKQRVEKLKHLADYLISHHGKADDERAKVKIRQVASRFCSKVFSRLDKCGRNREKFLEKYSDWLDKDFDLKYEDIEEAGPSTSRGRPKVSFEDSSARTKRRRAAELSETFETVELGYAVKKSLQTEGKQEEAKLIQEAVFTTPTRAGKIRKDRETAKKSELSSLTPDEAVSLLVEAKLTKHQYMLIRQQAKTKHADIYPAYHKVLEAKTRCYPPSEAIIVTEKCAEIQVQSLLDHTISPILEVQKPVLLNIPQETVKNLILLVKWGCDGSSGHSQYKQQFSDGTSSDSDIFLTSMVPLQLYAQLGEEKVIVWQNPCPSSARFCRPIRIQFLKETTQIAQEEMNYIQCQIVDLSPTLWTLQESNIQISVTHRCVMTMINEKVCNAITDTPSTQTCYVCKATPKEMNNIDNLIEKEENEETYQFGLSTLHAWIRFFECLLHVSYRLQIKKWQARGPDKKIITERKKHIQNEFKV